MICCFPYGAIVLTLVYVVFYLLIRLQLPDCLSKNDTKCATEGVNNLIWVWSTHFFNACIVGCLSLHLLASHRLYRHRDPKSNKRATIYGGLAFSCISIAFVTNGVKHISFGNSGIDDGRGMKGYYVLTAIIYTLMGSSSIFFALLSHATAGRGRTKLILLAVLNIVAAFFVVSACVMTITSQTEHFFVDTVDDDYMYDPSQLSLPLTLLTIGQVVWNGSSVLFLISLALSWGSMAKENTIFVMGLPNSLAAAGMIVAQLIVAVLRFLIFVLNTANDGEILEHSAAHRAAPLVFEYAALMTIFFAHNLIFSLFTDEDDIELSEKGGDSDDYPTDKSHYSGESSSQEEDRDEEEGFSIVLNGDAINVSNNTMYAHVESSLQDATDKMEPPKESFVKNIGFCKGAGRDIETGNNVGEKGNQETDSSSCSQNQNTVDREETPNNNGLSEHRIESIYDYVTSFLPYSQTEVVRNSPQGDVIPGSESNDIVSMFISAVTTSALANNFALPTFTENSCGDNNVSVTNGNAAEADSNTRDRAPQRKPSEPEGHVDPETSNVSKQDDTLAEGVRVIEPSSTESVSDKDNKKVIEGSARVIDENSEKGLDEKELPFKNENLDVEIETPKKADSKSIEALEAIEVPLESDNLKLANDDILADLHSTRKEENTKKRSSVALSRNTLRPKRKKKANKYRKKQPSRKVLDIPRPINEEEERISSSNLGGSCSISSKESTRTKDETRTRMNEYLEPELGDNTGCNAGKGVKAIYWERKPLYKTNIPIHTEDIDAQCRNNTDEALAFEAQTPLPDNNLFVEEKPKLPSNKSPSVEQETVEHDEKLQSGEGKTSIHEEENDQLHIPSSNNGYIQLSCLNESLLALTTALDENIGTYCKAPSVFPKIDVSQKALDHPFFTRSQSLRYKRQPSELPVLLQTATFNSDCISTLTSDFDESDVAQQSLSNPTNPSENPTDSTTKKSCQTSLFGEIYLDDGITNENSDAFSAPKNNSKEISLHSVEIEEGLSDQKADKKFTEVETKDMCDKALASDRGDDSDRNTSVVVEMLAETTHNISLSGQKEKVSVGSAPDNTISAFQYSCSDSSRSMSVDRTLQSSPPTPSNEGSASGDEKPQVGVSSAIGHELDSTQIWTQTSC